MKPDIERLNELSQELRVDEAGAHKHNWINSLAYFLSLTRPKRILEIGSFKGVSTEVFCQFADSVTAVDPFVDPEIEQIFLERMKPYEGIIKTVKGLSPEALKDMPDGSFDMCYIDGNHNTEAVISDIKECKRLVRPGGILAGHDYTNIAAVTVGVICALGREPEIQLKDGSWVDCNV